MAKQTCPECSGIFVGAACRCGFKAPQGINSPKPDQSNSLRCAWNGSRGQCLLLGIISSDGKRWFCSWHHDCLKTDRRTAEDFQEFAFHFERTGGTGSPRVIFLASTGDREGAQKALKAETDARTQDRASSVGESGVV